jgi:hypothetical protein
MVQVVLELDARKIVEAVRVASASCLSRAAADVLAERVSQVTVKGWTPQHDDEHSDGELSYAAAGYAVSASDAIQAVHREFDGPGQPTLDEVCSINHGTPWPEGWQFKAAPPRRMLVKAAALLLAEVERLDRMTGISAAQAQWPPEGCRLLPVGMHPAADVDRGTGLWLESAIVEPIEGEAGEAGLRWAIGRALSTAIGSVGEDGVVAIDPFDSDDITPLVDAVFDALRDFPESAAAGTVSRPAPTADAPPDSFPGRINISDVQDVLSLVGLAPSEKTVATWWQAQRQVALEWASATHLYASDNDDVHVPPRPPFLPDPWKGPYNDTGDVFGGPQPTVF